jgi:hypothetical protein
MTDKEKLKKLAQLFGDLIKIDGNEWLIDELLKTIGESKPLDQIASQSVIQNIHEYCVEKVIEKQANEFYSRFPIEPIKNQLIQDYMKMEHERRRDDFKSFSLCIYQQIENIVNYLYDNEVYPTWEVNRSKAAITFKDGGTKTVQNLVFGSADSWYANVKFKSILYFYYFSSNIKFTQQFYNKEDEFNEIYQVRNQNHRGTISKSFQEKILENIEGDESRYYFKFYGFLQDFVSGIEKSLLNKISTTETKTKANGGKKYYGNSLADNPVLQQLKNESSS